MSAFKKLAEGVVTTRQPGTASAVAAGPRCAVTCAGEVVCTFNVQTALGSNDFKPMISRSADLGVTWHDERSLWPHLQEQYSIFGSVSCSRQGELFFYGTKTRIDKAGESFWSAATQGLKENQLIWARSADSGRTWSEPTPISLPFPAAAEAPGAMCIADDGAWHACFSPYNTFDPDLHVPRNQVVLMSSSNQGQTWRNTPMLRFRDELSTAAEAWVVELADGRLLGSCWNSNQRDDRDLPNPYSLSRDGGSTWCPTKSTGLFGQSVALAALPDGSALFLYNQRRQGDIGVWMAQVRPTEVDFGIESNEVVWRAPTKPETVSHCQWMNFSFGEPSATVLDDGSILVVVWCVENTVGSIRYVKLVASEQIRSGD